MIAECTTTSKGIVITEPDFDRLNDLVQSPRYRRTHAMLLTGLKDELERGQVLASAQVPSTVITMRSRVRVRDLRDNQTETYTLVYPEEADINEGKLSVLAPLGIALLGARVGQVVHVKVPDGARRMKVERVLYQPEDAGDLHL